MMTRRDVARQLLLVSIGALIAAVCIAVARGQHVPAPAPAGVPASPAVLRIVR